MSRTNGDSQLEIVCVSFNKENERGIEVASAGREDNIFENKMEIPVESAKLQSNDTIITSRGITIKFPPKSYKNLKSNREARTSIRRKSSGIEK